MVFAPPCTLNRAIMSFLFLYLLFVVKESWHPFLSCLANFRQEFQALAKQSIHHLCESAHTQIFPLLLNKSKSAIFLQLRLATVGHRVSFW